MRRKLIFILSLIFSGFYSMAQLNPDSTSTEADNLAILPAKLYTQLANAIKPSSFTGASQNEGKALMASAGNTNDPAGIARDLSALAGYIKPDLFKSSFNVANFKSSAATVTTPGQVAAVFKNFESGVKPTALSGIWKMQKAGWMNELNRLK